jgi:hypothetical protein
MTLATDKTVLVAAAAHSHAVFTGAVTELFHTFQEAVKGTAACHDLSVATDTLREEMLRDDPGMPARLVNTWDAYVKSLTGAYQHFAHEIPHRMGHDDQSHVRNFALSIGRDAFSGARETSRQVFLAKVEGTTFEDRPARNEFKSAFLAGDKAA